MKKFTLFGLMLLGSFCQLSAADRISPADLIKLVQRLSAAAVSNGTQLVTVVNTRDVQGVFDAQGPVTSSPLVRLNTLEELQAFARKEWRSTSKDQLNLSINIDDARVDYDEDGYSVVVGSLTVNLPKHISVVQADK